MKNKILFAVFFFLVLFSFGAPSASAITVTVNATPTSVPFVNSGTTLSWDAPGAYSCTVSSGGTPLAGPLSYPATNSWATGSLSSTTTFTVDCYVPSGTISATSCDIPVGGSNCNSSVTWTTEDLTAGATEVTRNNPNGTHVSFATSGINIPNAVNYGPSTFYLYHNIDGTPTILSQFLVNASCVAGAIWDVPTSKCISSGSGMFGNLTPQATSCEIPVGSSSCDIKFSWDVTSPEDPGGSEVTSNTLSPGTVVGTGDSGTDVPFEIFYDVRTFFLYNNSTLLAQSTVRSDCEAGAYWDVNVCRAGMGGSPTANLFINPPSINLGDSVTLTWVSFNTDYCTSNFFSGNGPTSNPVGVVVFPPVLPSTYTLDCYEISSGSFGHDEEIIDTTVKKKPIWIEP